MSIFAELERPYIDCDDYIPMCGDSGDSVLKLSVTSAMLVAVAKVCNVPGYQHSLY